MGKEINRAPIWAAERIRIDLDAPGISTLVTFFGCPLDCAYCPNRQCKSMNTECRYLSPEELLSEAAKDMLYFEYTGGGPVFGGGEPLLHYGFIRDFADMAPESWRISIQTSLNVPETNVTSLIGKTDLWIVDVKDTDPEIYSRYTGRSNTNVIRNLKVLAERENRENVIIRIPNIPGYNTPENIENSKRLLSELGFYRFDVFDYLPFGTLP